MKPVKIGSLFLPVQVVSERAAMSREGDSIQYCQQNEHLFYAQAHYQNKYLFNAHATSAEEAVEKTAQRITQFIKDVKITDITINGVSHPVRSRKDLYDPVLDVESGAPIGTVHWWVKGEDDRPYYKCDVHFLSVDEGMCINPLEPYTYSVEGMGDTLEAALEDLKIMLED
jgi:hypothetical protein